MLGSSDARRRCRCVDRVAPGIIQCPRPSHRSSIWRSMVGTPPTRILSLNVVASRWRSSREEDSALGCPLVVEDAHAVPSAEVLWRRHSTRHEGSGQVLDDSVTTDILTNAVLLEIPSFGRRTDTRTGCAGGVGWRPTVRRQDVTSSVSQPDPIRGGSDGPNARPVEPSDASTGAFSHDSSTAQGPPGDAPAQPTDPAPFPRWLVILAWSTGPAALYALLSLAHAAFVERILSVDVGFGRSLAFWIGSIYLALLAWGFLPRRPDAWYARRAAAHRRAGARAGGAGRLRRLHGPVARRALGARYRRCQS